MAGEKEAVAELEGQVTKMEQQVDTLKKQLAAATDGNDVAKKAADLTAQLDEAAKALDQAIAAVDESTAKNAYLEAMVSLTPTQRAHYDTIAKADDKAKFLEMEEEEKEEEVKKATSKEESVVVEGRTIRKSVVGEDVFAVMKAQADRIAKNEKDLSVERETRKNIEFQKRADAEFSHVPGTAEERGQMLAAIDKMEDPLKKSFLAVFTQSEKLAKAGFEKLGAGGGERSRSDDGKISKAARDFDAKVNDIRSRDKCDRQTAMGKARKEAPDLFKAYQAEETAN